MIQSVNYVICTCCVFPAYAQQMKVFVFVLVCHGGNMDCWRTQYTSECGSKASASRVFINSQERACTSGRVESTAESASVYCGQTHIVDAGDLDCQMMVSHPYPCFSRPLPLFSTPTFSLSHRHIHSFSHCTGFLSHFLSFPSHFLSLLSLLSPIPLLSLSLMSLHEQVQLSMKLTGSELHSKNSGMKFIPLFLLCNHFSLIYDESH